MSGSGKSLDRARGWLIFLLTAALWGFVEAVDNDAIKVAAVAVFLAIAVVVIVARQREARHKAEAAGRPAPSLFATAPTPADARPAFSNKAFAVAFCSAMGMLMLLFILSLYAEEQGIVPPVAPVMWSLFAGVVAFEVWVFLEYARRVNAGVASRSLRLLGRLVLAFTMVQVMTAVFLWLVADDFGVSSALIGAWLLGGIMIPTALAGLALWMTRGRPMEPPRWPSLPKKPGVAAVGALADESTDSARR